MNWAVLSKKNFTLQNVNFFLHFKATDPYIVSPTYGPYFKIHEIKSMVLVFQIQIAQKLENKYM